MSMKSFFAFWNGEDIDKSQDENRPPFSEQLKQFLELQKNKIKKKKKSTIIGMILLFLFSLYITGVLTSIIRSAANFSVSNQFFGSGNTEVERIKPTFEFFSAVFSLIHIKYSIWAILIVLIIIAIILVWWIRNHITMGDYTVEERSGASYKKQLQDATLGSAREMNDKEIEDEFLELTPDEMETKNPNTLIFGIKPDTGNYLLAKPADKFDTRNQNCLVVGDAGSWKTSNFIIPQLDQICRAGQNALVTDTSGEVFSLTYPKFKAADYNIWVFNTVNTSCSDTWNFIGGIGDDLDLAKTITQTLCESTQMPDERPDPFFARGMQTLLPAIILLVNTEMRRFSSIEGILDFLIEYDTVDKMTNLFERYRDSQDEAYKQYKLFLTSPVRENFISNLAQRLDLFVSRGISRICSRDGFDMIKEFGDPNKKTVVYVITDRTYAFIAALFLNSAARQLKAFARDCCEKRVLPKKLYFVYEEFLTMGYVPNMGTNLSELRKYGMIFYLICQAIPQFYRVYEEKEAKEIMANCVYKFLYGAGDMDTAEEFEKYCGPATVRTMMKATSTPVIKQTDQAREGVQQRMLYDYNELYTLKLEEFILFTTHKHPLKLLKPFYKNLPDRKGVDLEEIHFSEYTPQNIESDTEISENKAEEKKVENTVSSTEPIEKKKDTAFVDGNKMRIVSVMSPAAETVDVKPKRRKSIRALAAEQMTTNLIEAMEELTKNRPCVNEDDVCAHSTIKGLIVFKNNLDKNGNQIPAHMVRFDIPFGVGKKGEVPDNEYRTYNSRYSIEDLRKCKLEKSGYIHVGWRRITEQAPDEQRATKDYYYPEHVTEANKNSNKTIITVPKRDIIIQPIFRAIPGYSAGSTKNKSTDNDPISQLVNKTISKREKALQGESTNDETEPQSEIISAEYTPKHEELKNLSTTQNTKKGILSGFKF